MLAVAVTDPVGRRVSPEGGYTDQVTVTGAPTNAGSGEIEVIPIVVAALLTLPLRLTVCVLPAVPPLSSVKVSTPLKEPTVADPRETDSEHCPPGASGDAAMQFWVEVKGDEALTPVIFSGTVPEFVRPTVWTADGSPALLLLADRFHFRLIERSSDALRNQSR